MENQNQESKMPEVISKDDMEKRKIAECTIKDKTFVITVDKKIFRKCDDGSYKECSEDDEETSFLRKYTAPPKSLDIDR